MSTRPRRPSSPPVTGPLLRAEIVLTAEELADAAGIRPARLARLIQLGLVEPVTPGASQFTAATVARLRRMLRLHRQLGVNLIGAAIIVDLLERLERLDAELARLRSGRPL
jgi:DNA-binding transcriptional MerR regulator